MGSSIRGLQKQCAKTNELQKCVVPQASYDRAVLQNLLLNLLTQSAAARLGASIYNLVSLSSFCILTATLLAARDTGARGSGGAPPTTDSTATQLQLFARPDEIISCAAHCASGAYPVRSATGWVALTMSCEGSRKPYEPLRAAVC